MKKIIFVLLLTPILAYTQIDTTLNSNQEIISINQRGINDLILKYKRILKNKKGIDGWKLQIKFTSKREDILPYKIRFTNLYPEIPTQIIFESPYYKLMAGKFKTKNEAMKIKDEIKKQFPATHAVPTIINKK